MSTLPHVQQDALAEYLSTRDTGCEESPTCLDCPLPQCKHDEPWGATAIEKYHRRNKRIFELRKQGVPIAEIMRQFQVSKRTIYHVLEYGGKRPGWKPPDNGFPPEEPGRDPRKIGTHNFKSRITPNAKRLQVPPAVYTQSCPRCNGPVLFDFTEQTAQCMSCGRDPRSKPVTSSADHSKSNGQF